MATLTVYTKIAGALADVTAVRLSNPAGTFGVCRGDNGAVVIADGVAMTRSALGTYTYDVTLPVAGVDYTWWAEVVYGGATHHIERTYHADPATVTLELSDLDEIDADNADLFLTEYGESILYYPASGSGVTITAIVNRGGEAIEDDPRRRRQPVTIAAKPAAADGIDPATWTDRDEVGVRRIRAGAVVRLRMVRAVKQDAGLVTWEVV